MSLADFDRYETLVKKRRPLFARLSPLVEFAFYLPVLRIVFRASWLASRGRYGAREWVDSSLRIIGAMERVGMRLEIDGMRHLHEVVGPAVFVSNHMSTLETFVLPAVIQPVMPITFVVKESLVRYPVFGPIMRSRDPVVVGRKNPREDLAAVTRGGEERLRQGISMIVFPQGTRYANVEAGQFNTLGAKLAVRGGVPVIPIALDTLAWGTGTHFKDLGPVDADRLVRIRFGAPLMPTGKGSAAHEASVKFIVGTIAEWNASTHCPGKGN